MDIDGFAKKIYNDLGPGYSERVYHNAMEVLLRNAGVRYESERIVPVPFEGHVIETFEQISSWILRSSWNLRRSRHSTTKLSYRLSTI